MFQLCTECHLLVFCVLMSHEARNVSHRAVRCRRVENNRSVVAFGLKCSMSQPSMKIRISHSRVFSPRRLRGSVFTRFIVENPRFTTGFDTETF
jgi:hypothetical protein